MRRSRYAGGTPRRLHPVPALDGLRGLALAAVVLFHYPTHSAFVGGMFGVGVFFVLSGFLVGAGLLERRDSAGRVEVGEFLARRAWRLVPALLAFFGVFLAVVLAADGTRWFDAAALAGHPGRPLPVTVALLGTAQTLTGWFNVVLAQQWPHASAFGHLWTLGVEAQFYVLIALVVWATARRRRLLGPLAVAVVVGSAVSPFALWNGGAGQNVIYFGTVPRFQQLVGGALLAGAWRRGALDRLPPAVLRVGAWAGSGVLVWLVLEVGNVPFKYLGAFSVAGAGAVLLVAHLVSGPERSVIRRVLAHPVLTYVGRRSYAIYLWHWPLALWTDRLPHPVGVPLGIGLSVGLAEASWRFVEHPAQRWSRRRGRNRAGLGPAPGSPVGSAAG